MRKSRFTEERIIKALKEHAAGLSAGEVSGSGIAIVPRPCAGNEAALGVLRVLLIAPARTVALSLFRRRQPLSRRKEGYLAALRDALKD